jgi:hypothetical protein
MNIDVEFIGISRILTGASKFTCTVGNNATYLDVVKLIAKKYPTLVGQVIRPDGLDLYPSNLFSLNGSKMIRPGEMDQKANDGDRLILMSILAGG